MYYLFCKHGVRIFSADFTRLDTLDFLRCLNISDLFGLRRGRFGVYVHRLWRGITTTTQHTKQNIPHMCSTPTANRAPSGIGWRVRQ